MSMLLRPMALLLACSLAACSGGNSTSRLDYKEAKSLQGLEVPPDLVLPENTGETELPAYTGEGSSRAVLPRAEKVRMARDGVERWLVVDAPVEELWPRLRSFWSTLGLALKKDEPALGVMETEWAENRADAPGGFFANLIKKINKNAYSVDTRDKYRLRLERREGGGSEIFITHYGLKEIVVSAQADAVVQTAWQYRPSDRELAGEVMNRMVLYLGGNELAAAEAKAASQVAVERARIDGEDIVIDEGFARGWRRVGIALDRLGVVVVDRNRTQGIYYVTKIDLRAEEDKKKGWFSSLFSSDKETAEQAPQLQVVVRGNEVVSRLSLRNGDGSARQDELTAGLRQRLYQELK